MQSRCTGQFQQMRTMSLCDRWVGGFKFFYFFCKISLQPPYSQVCMSICGLKPKPLDPFPDMPTSMIITDRNVEWAGLVAKGLPTSASNILSALFEHAATLKILRLFLMGRDRGLLTCASA